MSEIGVSLVTNPCRSSGQNGPFIKTDLTSAEGVVESGGLCPTQCGHT
jgi:hypothetical protein